MFQKRKWIRRQDVQLEKNKLFIFGDNMQRVGLGGQAAEMRGEPNALGIPTKHSPGIGPFDYFTDGEFPKLKPMLDEHFHIVEETLKEGADVIWPEDGIGTGLSELPTVAPKIHAYIESKVAEWDKKYGSGSEAGIEEENSETS